MHASVKEIQENPTSGSYPKVVDYRQAEIIIINQIQHESFPSDYQCLVTWKYEALKPYETKQRQICNICVCECVCFTCAHKIKAHEFMSTSIF